MNTEVITDSNIQFEYFDLKNLTSTGVPLMNQSDNIEENESLKKELTLTQEKFAILQSQVQHQAKLIELLLRMDMIKSEEEPDKKDIDDLQRKIQLCSDLIEECNIKFSEICNEKRRVLIVTNDESEKKAAIWNHFLISAGRDGQKNYECSYCGKSFTYKTMNTNKCRDHINEKCKKAPDSIRTSSNGNRSKPRHHQPINKSKCIVWKHFLNTFKDCKSIIICQYCGIEYSSRNATKCREHLAFKCPKIPEEVRDRMRSTFSEEYINAFNTNKRSTIWEHFSIISEDDKTVIQCIYCCMNYANKNATKCREHLLERCDKIPLNIRHKINNSFYESPLKTWTQIKIPIWKHFDVVTEKDRKQYKCTYCSKVYSSKNVTKFRMHLLYKCTQIPDNIKSSVNLEVTRSSDRSLNVENEETFYGDETEIETSTAINLSPNHNNEEEEDNDDKSEKRDSSEENEDQLPNSPKRIKVELDNES